MKMRFLTGLILVIFLLSSTNGVLAQSENINSPTTQDGTRQPYVLPERNENSDPYLSSQTLKLGTPGLSYSYLTSYGVTDEAYDADVSHINNPVSVFVDSNDNVFVTEERGNRVLKFRGSDSANLLTIGKSGMHNATDYTFELVIDAISDSDGNIWVSDNSRIMKYNSSGSLLLTYPADNDQWVTGSDNDHLNRPRGMVLDGSGKLFVADANNHRVQIFSIVGGTPIYYSSIGESGVAGADSTHFNYPSDVALDSSGRLYVVDSNNYRVQRCSFASSEWTCSTFFGVTGETGSNLSHIGGWFNGIAIKSDNIFIADCDNHRVLKCNSSGSCSVFVGVSGVGGTDNTHLNYPSDVTVDSSGNVYVSEFDNHRVEKFNSSGTYLSRLGTTQVPYLPDTVRFNTPSGIVVDSDGSLYFNERRGFRLVKLDSSGVEQWTAGTAGVTGSDNVHFGYFWDDFISYPAVDSSTGKIYDPDPGNNRIQIFNSSTGAYMFTWTGTGSYEFSCPQAVAISQANGDLYVSDRCNNRILVFSSSRVFKMQIGTGNYGSASNQFAGPTDVVIDQHDNIYVADSDNARVQKCTISGSTYSCSTFAGITGEWSNDFSHLSWNHQVMVDSSDRVFVADSANSRVMVFDSTGSLLTTLGGDWLSGSENGRFMEPFGLTVDGSGNLYVADSRNSRIEKFSAGITGWTQTNINGFGYAHNSLLTSLEVFNDQLYVGACNWDGMGAQVWQSSDGHNWSQVSDPGFGVADPTVNACISDLQVFNGKLYAATAWGSDAGQLWRTSNGTYWEQVVSGGFGIPSGYLSTLTEFDGNLYIGASNTSDGTTIWRSISGDAGSWSEVVAGGLGDSKLTNITGWATFGGNLYAAVETNSVGPVRIMYTTNGTDWDWASPAGFGDSDNLNTSNLASFNGYLYVGTYNPTTGGQLWRSNNGTYWTQVMGNGFGDTYNQKVGSLFTFDGSLYAGTDNGHTGVEVWMSSDGTSWHQINPDGFGLSSNDSFLWNSIQDFNNSLYYGVSSNGGLQVWQPILPAAFTKSSPANGATGQSITPTLTWGTSTGAVSYEYCIGTSDPCSNWTTNGTSTSKAITGLTSDTTYYWQVRALDAQGAITADSDTCWSFTTRATVLTSLDPSSATVGSADFTLTVNGSGFVNGDTVFWNGTPRSTSFVSSTQLTASISPPDLVSIAIAQVTVTDPELVTSNSLPFSVYTFADVPPTHSFWRYIEGFYAEGITTGCSVNPMNYCPNNPVTRAAMAVFLLRAKNGTDYQPPAATGTFTDLPVTGKEWMQPWVEEFYREGITTGCSADPLQYCPENSVTRASMAVFLLRAKYGANYHPPAATGIFADLPVTGKEWMEPWVEQFYREGITTGCGVDPLRYCPEDPVKRQAMAVFIDRAFGLPQLP